jgi:hypothetical protein
MATQVARDRPSSPWSGDLNGDFVQTSHARSDAELVYTARRLMTLRTAANPRSLLDLSLLVHPRPPTPPARAQIG